MEKSPSGGCQLGDRSSDTEAWRNRAGAHGQEPMKTFQAEEYDAGALLTHQASQRVEQQRQLDNA